MSKKLLALILSITMLMSAASLSVSAEEEIIDRNTVSNEITAQEGEGPSNAVWVTEPVEDAGTAEGEFVEDIADTLPCIDTDDLLEDAQSVLLEEDITPYSLNDLQIVNMDELSEIPKYAAVYDARAVSGWQKENGYWYYYKNGVRATGWLLLNDSGTDHYYYLDPAASGRMVTGLKTITSDGKAHKYYFTSDGPMAHGWYRLQLPGDSGYFYYYFGIPERPLTGYMRVSEWLEDTESSPVYWYYLGTDGHMYSYQWLYYSGEWYYFAGAGYMITSTFYTISSKLYYFSDSGAVETGWFKVVADTFCADERGCVYRGVVQMSPYVKSTFDSSGRWVSDELIPQPERLNISTGKYFEIPNVRWDNLQVNNGHRGAVLSVSGQNFNTKSGGILRDSTEYWSENSNGLVTMTYTTGANADVWVSEGTGFSSTVTLAETYLQNTNLEWLGGFDQPSNKPTEPSFMTGSATKARIIFNSNQNSYSWSSTEIEKVMRHELGHVVGLRHPYERLEAEPIHPSVSLMHWTIKSSLSSFSLTEYDLQELNKTYPDWVVSE